MNRSKPSGLIMIDEPDLRRMPAPYARNIRMIGK